jgi:hypothetical protein
MGNFKTLILAFLLISESLGILAQCDDNLVKKAVSESGSDALFIKEFISKQKRGTVKRPESISKYLIRLDDSTVYRFNITSDKAYEGTAILQLFNKGRYLGSTYDHLKKENRSSFDFECKETDTYQILISFSGGKSGCAAGVVSIVVNDSTKIDPKHLSDILYLGMMNPLYIAYDKGEGNSLYIETNQGKITEENGNYFVIPEKPGTLTVEVQVIDDKGNSIEAMTTGFKVLEMPNPIISINGNTGGHIFKDDILKSNGPELNISRILNSEEYKIIGFSISKHKGGTEEYRSYDHRFTYGQLRFIEELEQGDTFYLMNVKVLKPNNKTIVLNPVKYIIQ